MAKFTVDLRFVFLERELWALGEFLRIIEPQITYLRDQDRIQTNARLSEQGLSWDDVELQLELQDRDQRAAIVFPRLLRNPFLVTLWAAFESGVAEVARNLARTANTSLTLKDMRGRHFLDAAIKYYNEILRTPIDLDDNRVTRLSDLLKLRNVVAHANGDQRSVPTEKWRAIEPVLKRVPSIEVVDGYLIVSAQYLTDAYGDVDSSLRDVIMRVRGPSFRRLDAG